MFFDVLIVFVVSLISSLFLCTGSVHGFPQPEPASSLAVDYLKQTPSSELSSLRLVHHEPLASIDYDLGGDIAGMLLSQSDSLRKMNDPSFSPSLPSPVASSPMDGSVEAEQVNLKPDRFELLYRKFLSSSDNDRSYEDQYQRKRLVHSSISNSERLPAQFGVKSAAVAPYVADLSQNEYLPDKNQAFDAQQISPSLQTMVDHNPILRNWLTFLLEDMMKTENESSPFKFGRRRK